MEEEHKSTEKQETTERKGIRAIVRMLSTDIPGNMSLYSGLTRIKGISWGLSNAVCYTLKIERDKKIGALSEDEVQRISDFIKNPKLPSFMLNRRKDIEAGTERQIIGADLDLTKEFDIKRLKKIKSYKGLRHSAGQPVRGQRTRSHFRKNRTGGIMKMKKLKKIQEAKK